MSASDDTLKSAAEDLIEDTLNSPVEEYRERSRSARRPHAHLKTILEVRNMLNGLASPRRGMNLAKIDRPA